MKNTLIRLATKSIVIGAQHYWKRRSVAPFRPAASVQPNVSVASWEPGAMPTNQDRADRAYNAILVYATVKDKDDPCFDFHESLIDLLTDAMHYIADGEECVGVLEIEFEMARKHFLDEQAEESQQT